MAVAPTKPVAPGDASIATAANRVGTGTRAPGSARVEALGSGAMVSSRHEWRPAEDHGYGEPGFDNRHRRQDPDLGFTPLVLRFAAVYVANQEAALEYQGALLHVLFADTLRGVGVYEANLRLFAANDTAAAQRGHQINRYS